MTIPFPSIRNPSTIIGSLYQVSVAITTGGRRGSGILVSPNVVLTCGHVVKGTKGIKLSTMWLRIHASL